MRLRTMGALVAVEWKKLYRDIMNLIVLILMPVGLALIFYFALGGVSNDYYPEGVASHFEFLLPGLMGYSIIYMGMMVALGLVDYREAGILKRIQATPVSPMTYLGSQLIAYGVIAVVQAFIVLLVARLLGFEPQGGLLGLLLACPSLALLGITAVGLGLITATVAKSSGAAGGLAVIYILPMMMFGAWLAVFNEATLTIARFMPNHYVTETLYVIFFTGDLSNPVIWQDFLILAGISLVITGIGIVLFRRAEFG
ncbi:MAG: ABC transporter permease [Anaerolineae bacterium]|jgi:ABC-2 type transport system permease protein